MMGAVNGELRFLWGLSTYVLQGGNRMLVFDIVYDALIFLSDCSILYKK